MMVTMPLPAGRSVRAFFCIAAAAAVFSALVRTGATPSRHQPGTMDALLQSDSYSATAYLNDEVDPLCASKNVFGMILLQKQQSAFVSPNVASCQANRTFRKHDEAKKKKDMVLN